MKKMFIFITVLAVSGCVHLPSFQTPSPSAITVNGSLHGGAVPAAPPVHPSGGSTQAIQHFVDWGTGLACLGGVAAVAFGAFLIYSGHVWAGIKFVIGGILTPICAIWFAFHWLMVMILCLFGAGIALLVIKFTVIEALGAKLKPELLKAETWLAANAKI